MEELEIICPITHQIFLDPVLASDGFTYEKKAIKKVIENNKISPMTKQIISSTTFPNLFVKHYVNSYLEKNPEKKKEQFFYDWYKVSSFKELMDVIHETYVDDDLYEIFNNEIYVRYWINNLNINELTKERHSLIGCLCKFCSNVDMINLAVEKGANLELENCNKWRPIHFACRYSKNPDIIEYLIEKGVNLEIPNNDGWYPIHLASKCSTPEIIRLLIDKGANINIKVKNYSLFSFINLNENIKDYSPLFYSPIVKRKPNKKAGKK